MPNAFAKTRGPVSRGVNALSGSLMANDFISELLMRQNLDPAGRKGPDLSRIPGDMLELMTGKGWSADRQRPQPVVGSAQAQTAQQPQSRNEQEPWLNDPLVREMPEAPWLNDPITRRADEADDSWLGQTMIGRGLQAAGDVATSAYEAAFPERDPQHADKGGFTGANLNLDDLGKISRGKFSAAGFEDKAWRNMVLKTLGDRVIEMKRDKDGNELVRYRGDDGKEYEEYINQPGLDNEDVDRFIMGSLPYLYGALITSRLPGIGKSLVARAPAQGVTAAGVSVGQDIGADQPVDLGKAAWTGAAGGVGEVAGVGAAKLLRRITEPKYYDAATGQLTDAGRKEAARLGLDPDQVEGDVARRMAEIKRAEDPRAAAAGVEAGDMGIPTTKGQRTKDPEQLNVEEQMRRSLFGPGAREVITGFDQTQREAIEQAAGAVQERVAPGTGRTVQETGQEIGEGIRSARSASDKQVAQAWKEVEDLYPVLTDTATGNAARDALSQGVRQHFDNLGFFPDEKLTPTAHQMMNELTDFSKNIPTNTPYELLGKTGRAPSIDNMRRRLLARYEGAAPGQDKAAARAIYSGFNDWIEDVSTNQFIRTGKGRFTTKDQAAKIKQAQTVTREQRRLFEPREGRKLTPAGKILTDIAENGDTPERIVQSIFGANVTGTPKAGTVDALRHLKRVFNDDPSKMDQVKASYFLKMVTGKDGKLLSPGHLRTSINKAFANQKSVVDELFTPDEQAFMRRFQNAVETVVYTPPNPSGSSYALEAMRRKRGKSGLQYVFRRLGTRSTFQGEVWQGTMYHWLARVLPNIFGAQDAASRSLARRATSELIDFKPDQGRIMSAIAASYAARDASEER